MIQILTRVLTAVGILLIFKCVMNEKVRELRANLKNDHIIVHLPLVFRWVGLVDVVVFSLFISLMYCFPSIVTGGRDIWINLAFGVFILIGLFIIIITFTWRIDIFRSEDYFIIRTFLGKSYTIKYSDIISYKITKDMNIIIKTSSRKFTIDHSASNIEFFKSMLRRHTLPNANTL